MPQVLPNVWRREGAEPIERAAILDAATAPQGLHLERLRFLEASSLPMAAPGSVVSLFAGSARLTVAGRPRPLSLGPGVTFYLPPGIDARLDAERGAELVRVSAPHPSQAAGAELVLRSERFVSACAIGGQSLRWTLTPQYLSRRIFLHHDRTLRSKSGDPVSWFHTTMFDVAGLPPNDEGRSVFKMSYNSRTEINVCHDVSGDAAVRFALHPYAREGQAWGLWEALDGERSYHLDEAAGGPEEERVVDPSTGAAGTLRNKHEVRGSGHVTLFCLFDPAPTGVERHRPGEYSDYEPFSEVSKRDEYAAHQRAIARFDRMVDRLSLAEAEGDLDALRSAEEWATFEEGRAAQRALEAQLCETLAERGDGRDRVVRPWLSG